MKSSRIPSILLLSNLVFLIFLAARPDSETFDKISVREFELLDKNGKQRVSIKMETESDEVVLRLKDGSGTIRVKMGANEKGSGMVLLDNDTNPGVHMLANEKGAVLTLTGKDGKKREY